MNLSLSAPAKTFLSGEYAVLVGGPALVLLTAPRFELKITVGEHRIVGIPDGAPARRWLAARAPLIQKYQIEFVDPFAGAGGLGASGAQFLLAHAFTSRLQHSFGRAIEGVDVAATWNDYQVMSNTIGSGADVLAQATGGVALVDVNGPGAVAHAWPYPDLGWTLVRTHQKIATHEHLNELSRESLSALVAPARACAAAFGRASAPDFVATVAAYARTLADLGLRAPATADLVDRIGAQPWCVLAKGCGALGADVILILHPREDARRAREFFNEHNLKIVATDDRLTHGLEVRWT